MDRITVREAAAIIGVCEPRVYQLIAGGELPAERFGAQWALDPKVVKAFERKKPTGRPRKEGRR